MSASRTYPVAVDDAFAALLPLPLPQLFDRRYGIIPAIKSVDGPEPWGVAGQTRTIHLADGGSAVERLLRVDAPSVFAYELADVRGPMKLLAARVEGEWRVDPAGTGARVTWQWTVHEASAASAPLLPVFARIWSGYARQALQRLEELLVR